MFKRSLFFGIIYCSLFLACNSSKEESLTIEFSADSSQILFKNIEPSGLLQLRNNLSTDSAYQKLVTVFQTPSDHDSTSMEMVWPGQLKLQGDTLIYMPANAFVKGKTYLVETIVNTHFASRGEVLQAEIGHQLKANRKTLIR